MAVSVDLDKALDKAYEGKSLKEILDASPAALAGVSDADAEHLAAAFNIKTVRQLGSSLPRSSRWRTPASFLCELTQNCPYSSEWGQFCVCSSRCPPRGCTQIAPLARSSIWLHARDQRGRTSSPMCGQIVLQARSPI